MAAATGIPLPLRLRAYVRGNDGIRDNRPPLDVGVVKFSELVLAARLHSKIPNISEKMFCKHRNE